MNRLLISTTAILLIITPLYAQANANAISELEAYYQLQGAAPFNAANGKALWEKEVVDAKTGKNRNCSNCHSSDLTKQGKHSRTLKVIQPIAPSVNTESLTKVKKIKKWFVRNCKGTFGRECTVQEKGDILAFLKNL